MNSSSSRAKSVIEIRPIRENWTRGVAVTLPLMGPRESFASTASAENPTRPALGETGGGASMRGGSLGAALRLIRRRIVASGAPLLNSEELERELRERRGLGTT